MVTHWLNNFKDIVGAETYDVDDERKNAAYGIIIPNRESYEYFNSFYDINKQFIEVFVSKAMSTIAVSLPFPFLC